MRFNGTARGNGFKVALFCLALGALGFGGAGCSTGKLAGNHSNGAKNGTIPRGSELGVNLPMRVEKLSNGLQVIMVEDHTVPVISYQTWFKVGSVDEKPGYTGIAHLFEHLMFKGTPKYPEKQFFLQLEAKGAEVNAYTTRDYTVYYENFVPSLLERVIDMESDRMANLTLSDQVLNTERMVVFEERRMRTENTPEGRMQEELWRLAYRVHPYQWPVIGYPEDLLRITTDDLKAFFKAHYQPANASIVIVGDFDPEKTLALIKNYYGSIERQDRPPRKIPSEPDQNEERRLVLRDEVANDRLMVAYHVPSALEDDAYALDVLSNILFEGTNSRGHRKLVEETETSLGVSGTDYTPSYPGLFIISTTLQKGKKAETAEALLYALIKDIQDNGVTQEEVKRAVRQLTVQAVDGVRTPYGLGSLIGTVQVILGDPYEFGSDLAKYIKVTPDDVKRVAQKYLIPNSRSVVTLVPEKGSK
jgi:zinc protease